MRTEDEIYFGLEEEEEEREGIISKILGFLFKTTLITMFFFVVIYLISFIPVMIFAETEYVDESKYIYDLWQNQYSEEYLNGKTTSTKEINRYYYKYKVNNTYYDGWVNYSISDITIIDNAEKEQLVIERLHHKNKFIDEMYNGATIKKDHPQTKAHFYIHKNTAKKLGINI